MSPLTTCSSQAWVEIYLPNLPLFLSTVYTISVLIFLAAWNECSWFSMTQPISIQCILLAFLVLASPHIPWILVLLTSSALALISTYLVRERYVLGPKPKFWADCIKGKVIWITGANTGIGKETAKQLLELGCTLILACRSESKARGAMEDISSVVAGAETRMHFIPLDLADLASVRSAVETFEGMGLSLDVLINNAGVMMGERHTSAQGYEMTMQCNHLGHFLLTLLLLPHLRRSGGRVITITSSTYTLSKRILLEDLQCERRAYSLFSQYSQSKLANILFAYELSRREPSIKSIAIHPGLVRTEVVRNMPFWLRFSNQCFGFILACLQKTPEAGAYTSVYCSVKDGLTGLYYVNSREADLRPCATNSDDAERLWNLSEELVGYKYEQTKDPCSSDQK